MHWWRCAKEVLQGRGAELGAGVQSGGCWNNRQDAELQSFSRGAEVLQRRCRYIGFEEVVQRCRGAEMVQTCCSGSAEVQGSAEEEVQMRCRGGGCWSRGADVQMCRCTVVLGAGMQGCRWCR